MIYAHRGVWNHASPPNSLKAIQESFKCGFNLETDFRSHAGKVVIAHDVHDEKIPFDLDNYFQTSIAINIKEDGLLPLFLESRDQIIESSSFFFDGSIPEMYRYHKVGMPHALRISEYEKELPWESPVIWLDAFESEWWIGTDYLNRLLGTSRVIVVSPELHNRDYRLTWDIVKERILSGEKNLSICTDYPREFLKELNV
jgi:hypothetical protein